MVREINIHKIWRLDMASLKSLAGHVQHLHFNWNNHTCMWCFVKTSLTCDFLILLFVHAYPYMYFTHHAYIWYILPPSLSLSHTHTHKSTYTGIPPEDNPNRVLNYIKTTNSTPFFDVYLINSKSNRVAHSVSSILWELLHTNTYTHTHTCTINGHSLITHKYTHRSC